MTQREFFTAIVNGTINADIQAYAADAIVKLDKRNATRASKPTKSQQANVPLLAEIRTFLTGKRNVLAAEVAAHLDVTPQKASGLLKLLVDGGEVAATEIKVPKQGKRKAYTLTNTENTENTEDTEETAED
jgi:hypothetical protein